MIKVQSNQKGIMESAKKNSLLISLLAIIISNLLALVFAREYKELLTLLWVYWSQAVLLFLYGLYRLSKSGWMAMPFAEVVLKCFTYALPAVLWFGITGILIYLLPGFMHLESFVFLPVDALALVILTIVFCVSLPFRKLPSLKSFERVITYPFLAIFPLFITLGYAMLGKPQVLLVFVAVKTLSDVVVEMLQRCLYKD
jgi:hypothetical protein